MCNNWIINGKNIYVVDWKEDNEDKKNKNSTNNIVEKNKDLIVDSNKSFNYPGLNKENKDEDENLKIKI